MTESSNNAAVSIYRQAFGDVKSEIEAVADEHFIQIALDIPSATVTTQGAYAQIVALRPSFVERLPKFDISLVDKLETYALAMFCAHADYKAAMDPPAELADLIQTAIARRAILLANVNSLIAYGLLAPEVLNDLLGINGYKNVMTDLATLASILRTHADKVAERTTVRFNELAEAEDLAAKLGETVGVRQLSPQVIAQAARNRQAAFTLFMRAYEEVRAAIQYLRHHEGDADAIMPSLFAGRGGRKKAVGDKPDAPAPSPTPVVAPPTSSIAGNNGAMGVKLASDDHGPFVH